MQKHNGEGLILLVDGNKLDAGVLEVSVGDEDKNKQRTVKLSMKGKVELTKRSACILTSEDQKSFQIGFRVTEVFLDPAGTFTCIDGMSKMGKHPPPGQPKRKKKNRLLD